METDLAVPPVVPFAVYSKASTRTSSSTVYPQVLWLGVPESIGMGSQIQIQIHGHLKTPKQMDLQLDWVMDTRQAPWLRVCRRVVMGTEEPVLAIRPIQGCGKDAGVFYQHCMFSFSEALKKTRFRALDTRGQPVVLCGWCTPLVCVHWLVHV